MYGVTPKSLPPLLFLGTPSSVNGDPFTSGGAYVPGAANSGGGGGGGGGAVSQDPWMQVLMYTYKYIYICV